MRVKSPRCGVNWAIYTLVRCNLTLAVFFTLRLYPSDNAGMFPDSDAIWKDAFQQVSVFNLFLGFH